MMLEYKIQENAKIYQIFSDYAYRSHSSRQNIPNYFPLTLVIRTLQDALLIFNLTPGS